MLYGIVEYTLFSFFLNSLYLNKLAKKVIIISILPFYIFSAIIFGRNGTNQFSNGPFLIEFMAFIIFIIYFFYEKMKTVFIYPLYQSITFWICVGLFFYFTGNFFFLVFNQSSVDEGFRKQMIIIYTLVTVSKNILLSLAFLANEREEAGTDEELLIPKDLKMDDFTLTNSNN
ncbi:MAG: hypothetical protein JWQ27_904 [Ferruginibacter sp.]|nr:hypothetical protein [Ferruginibacter sp.]